MSDEPIRAAGYIRVSTAQQAKGESLDAQREKVTKRIEAEGWELTKIYEDAGRSGRTDNRPQLQALRGDLDGIDRLVIPRLDRLGRSAADLFRIYGELEAADVGLVSIGESMDTSTATGKLLRAVLSAVAELESSRIAERLEDFQARKVERGLYNGGPRPYGYRQVKGELEIDPAEATIVRRIFDEYNAGKALGKIADGLTADGIATPRGGRWSAQRLAERIDSVLYRGDIGGRLHDDVRPGSHEAIVTRDIWAKAAARRQATRGQGGKGRGRPTTALLPGGFLRCLHCGSGMRPQRGRATYRCAGHDELRNGCEMGSVSRAALDGALRAYFLTYVFDPEASRAEFEAERASQLEAARTAAQQSAARARTDEARRRRIEGLMQDGDLTPQEWREQDAALKASVAEAKAHAARQTEIADGLAAPIEGAFEDWEALRQTAVGDLSKTSDREALRAALQRIFEWVGVGRVDLDTADDAPPLPDHLPTFSDRGTDYVLWLEIRPDALDWQPGDPTDWPTDGGGDPLAPEPSPHPARRGLPAAGDANRRQGSALRTSCRIVTSPRPS